MERLRGLLPILFILSGMLATAQTGSIYGNVVCTDARNCDDAIITLEQTSFYTEVEPDGSFALANMPYGKYKLIAFALGYQLWSKEIQIDSVPLFFEIRLIGLEASLDPVVVQSESIKKLGISRLKSVEGANLYAGKKTELIQISSLQANLSTNNARQVFGKITGLNIWESDAAGLQLGVGGRGLSPNRTANFNTRQNGYDISADALGYPEAYYSPPMEAVERIEVVRGAASLQYGTQFGGMLNFVTKQGPADIPFQVTSRQTLGSYGYFGSFNSLGGTVANGKLNHYSYFSYKRGDSWRANSGFESYTGSVKLKWKPTKKWTHSIEYTGMQYLAQQAGGLTDQAFNEDPQQSFRERNWFKVSWHLPSWQVQFQADSNNLIEMRLFGLIAERSSIGNLERINRLDLGGNRNLIQGKFKNIGQELRWLHSWKWLNQQQHSLFGYRLYFGHSNARQGDGYDGQDANFAFINPNDLENSDYRFDNFNAAIFWEQVFQLNKRLTVSPGIRGEYIKTGAAGYYRQRVFDLAGNVISDRRIEDERSRGRSFVIAGLGTQYTLGPSLEFYANVSQNYRAINFTDLRISNPSLRVDSMLRDERGFTADIGVRGERSGKFIYEVTAFYLQYDGRIGQVLRNGDAPLYLDYRFRTNVANSRTTGIEMMGETNLFRFTRAKSLRFQDLNVFVNLALIRGVYDAPDQTSIDGNKVEMVPNVVFRSGIRYRWKYLRASLQYAYTGSQFSDATNSVWTSSAVEGKIPAYAVMDFSIGWTYRIFSIDASINNLTNTRYFTRRADSYPGPGIIPAEARAVYLTFGIQLGK